MPDESSTYSQNTVVTDIDGSNAVFTLAFPGATAGEFDLDFGDETAASISNAITAADLRDELAEKLSFVDEGDVAVTSPSAKTFRVEFTGTLAGQPVASPTVANNTLENAEEDPVVPVVTTVSEGTENNPLAVQIPDGPNDGRGETSVNDPDTNPTPAEARAADGEAYGDS